MVTNQNVQSQRGGGWGGWGGRGRQDILLFRVGIFEWPLQSTTETEY